MWTVFWLQLVLLGSSLEFLSSKIVYVDISSSNKGGNCGSSPETACSTILYGFRSANSGDTILLFPGLYSGLGNEGLTSLNFTITSINILGSGQQDTVIQCQEELRFLYSDSNFLQSISRLTIRNCSSFGRRVVFNQDGGGLLVTGSSSKITIINTTFEDNMGRMGGAISMTGGALTLIGCTFLKNKVGTRGGAIASQDSGLTVTSCFFIGNEARSELIDDPIFYIDSDVAGRSGAIYAKGGSRMTITNSIFHSNFAQISGGAISINLISGLDVLNCSFTNNSIIGTGKCLASVCDLSGGAIDLQNMQANLENCSFHSNKVVTTDATQFAKGGAFAAIGESSRHSISMNHCVFSKNSATGVTDNGAGGLGGAVQIDGTPIILTNCTFIDNTAESQGDFSQSSFGGAIYLSECDGDVSGTIFKGNLVNPGLGGAVYLSHASLSFRLTTFLENTVSSSYEFKGKGGALAAQSYSDITINSCIFERNNALAPSILMSDGVGGALFFHIALDSTKFVIIVDTLSLI